MAARAYDDAERLICTALRAEPQDDEAQLLLHLVRARRAAVSRDFGTAKRLYESLLRRDPDHAAAKKELIMISALA